MTPTQVIELKGASLLIQRLQALGDRALHAGGQALWEIGEEIMTESKTNYVPVLTGNLKATGKNYGVEYDGTVATDTLGYGDTSIKYGIYVHEITGRHHPHGQDHYLSTPVKARVPRFRAQMAAKLGRAIERAARSG